MSYIPDTRHKLRIDFYGQQTDELNPYWYRILEGDDATELNGYDWAVECITNSLETHLENAGFDKEKKRQKIINAVLECLESNRDELVVSMLDNMNQEDYDRRFEEVKDRPEDESDRWEDSI